MQRALPRRGCRQRSDGGSELRANDFPLCALLQLRRWLAEGIARRVRGAAKPIVSGN